MTEDHIPSTKVDPEALPCAFEGCPLSGVRPMRVMVVEFGVPAEVEVKVCQPHYGAVMVPLVSHVKPA